MKDANLQLSSGQELDPRTEPSLGSFPQRLGDSQKTRKSFHDEAVWCTPRPHALRFGPYSGAEGQPQIRECKNVRHPKEYGSSLDFVWVFGQFPVEVAVANVYEGKY